MEIKSTINLKDYKLLEKIGNGAFGEVFKVMNKKSSTTYAAKVSYQSLDDNSAQMLRDFSREVNILSKVKHPSVIDFIGFSSVNFHKENKPVLITELLPNGSLNDILLAERKSLADFDWNMTRKLINIYGIASAMSFLHQHHIIHRDLKPANILMDDYLCPKIADFGFSKIMHTNKESMTIESSMNIKGTPIYLSPEIWLRSEYGPACDVYAFGIIVYEIITNSEPYKDCDIFQIRTKVLNGERPEMDSAVPDCYRELIEHCWSQDPKDRPSFEEIANNLRIEEDNQFITELVNETDFWNYVDFIDDFQKVFDSNQKIIKIDEFIKNKLKSSSNNSGNKSIFESVRLKAKEKDDSIEMKKSKRLSFSKNKTKENMIYPMKEFNSLSQDCQNLVIEAQNDPEKQFEVGCCLFEGKQNFPLKTEIGIKYLEQSIKGGCIDSVIYFSRQLIEAKIIPQDLNKAEKLLKKHLKSANNSNIQLLLGKIRKKEKNYKKAIKYFDISSRDGNGEAMYEYGKLLLNGKGCQKDKKEALKYFEMSKKNGFDKSFTIHSKHKSTNSIQSDDDDDPKEKSKSQKIPSHLSKQKHDKEKKTTVVNTNQNSKPIGKTGRILRISSNYNAYLGSKYQIGDGVPVDKNEAVRYYKIAIDEGDSNAMVNYANMLLTGDGIPVNKSEAVRLFKMAIDKGNDEAMNGYALMLKNGDGISVNKKEAVRLYKMAIDKGNDKAMNSYALMLKNGDGISVNKKEAARLFKMAIDKGNESAMNNYAIMLKNGDGIPVDKKEAVRLFKMAIDKGNENAMNSYALMLKNGDGIPVNKSEAARYYMIAIDKGNVNAMNNYAIMLKNGDGIPVNKSEAARYYKMAADKGNVNAMNSYAIMLDDGDGIPVNKKEAVRLYKMAIDKGSVGAMYNYAIMLKNGDGIPVNKSEAARYYKMAADKGNVNAMNSYAIMLDDGDGIPVNKSEAARYYKMAIEKGDDDAMSSYAYMLKRGDGVPVDKKEAVRLFKMAIDKGNENAMNGYAYMLLTGDGVPVNKSEAVRLYKMAIDKGDSIAMHNYACMLDDGNGVPVNKSEAARYYKMAIDDGNDEAMNSYANMLKNGDGIPVNKKEAIRLYKMAIDKGNDNAMNNYANMLLNGDGIPVNKSEAARFYKMAIDKGNESAMLNYGNMLRTGDGIPVNKSEAARFYKMAIDKGDDDAMVNYANMLYNGNGIPENKKEAVRLYKLAAGKGNKMAKEKLSKIMGE